METSELFYLKSLDIIEKELDTSKDGLSSSEVKKRIAKFGLNTLETQKKSLVLLFLSQFKSPLVYVLLLASLLSFLLENYHEAILIFLILFINAVIGFLQEIKAATSIEALKNMTENHITVRRDGKLQTLSSSQLVPGDMVELNDGDIVPADIRLVHSEGLHVDESVITGESIPVVKNADIVLTQERQPYELDNILHCSTTITKGEAKGYVVTTGTHTYFASIAKKAEEASPETPLTIALHTFIKKHLAILSVIIGLTAILSLWQGRSYIETIYLIIAELVSAIPEGLPIVVTLVLTIGAMALSKKKIYIRHLPSAQTLGSTTVIASDKTGTITEGKLSVVDTFSVDNNQLQLIAALANDAAEHDGDPLDKALVDWMGVAAFERLQRNCPESKQFPFDTTHRLMASVNRLEGEERLFVKGAFESLKRFAQNSGSLSEFEKEHDRMASEGLRVIAFGYGAYESDEIDTWQIKIVGLIGFLDPAKEGVLEAINLAQRAGVKVIMITGDNELTAKSIAKSVGIYTEGDQTLTGMQMDEMDDETLKQELKHTTVLARVLPEHKYRIVKMLQANGEIVAVTGDGANDIPAIKAADLGIAMGAGTDAAKSSSKMVLADNNISVIVDAIKQGRTIASNIRKSIYFLVTTSLDEVIVITTAILMSLPLPFSPVQILWINLVSDSALDKTFPFMKDESDVMARPPTKMMEQFLDRVQLFRVIYAALVISSGAILIYIWMLDHGDEAFAISTLFTAFIIATWVNGLQSLKENEPFLKNIKKSFQINPYIFYGIGIGIILQLVAIYAMSDIFNTLPLDKEAIWVIVFLSLWVFGWIEVRKWAELVYKKRKECSMR